MLLYALWLFEKKKNIWKQQKHKILYFMWPVLPWINYEG